MAGLLDIGNSFALIVKKLEPQVRYNRVETVAIATADSEASYLSVFAAVRNFTVAYFLGTVYAICKQRASPYRL